MRLLAAALASALLVLPTTPAVKAADETLDRTEVAKGLLAHSAVYDIALETAASSSNVQSVSGRLVFEVTGSVCEGFTVNSRFVTEIDDQDGGRRVTDLRSSTYESADADSFEFLSRTFADQRLQQEAKGSAERTADGLSVELSMPEEAKVRFDKDVLFPTEHLVSLIAAAEADRRIVEADLYDGSEDGRKVYTTTAIIGAVSEDPVGEDDGLLAKSIGTDRHWPVNLSYFDLSKGETGELTPVYTLRFMLFENGVSRALTLDYGNFSLTGTLAELDRLPRSTCK